MINLNQPWTMKWVSVKFVDCRAFSFIEHVKNGMYFKLAELFYRQKIIMQNGKFNIEQIWMWDTIHCYKARVSNGFSYISNVTKIVESFQVGNTEL